MKQIREKLSAMAELSQGTPVDEVIRRTYRLLTQAPSKIVSATLEDALTVKERPNIPGTTSEQWPNWSLALPKSLEELERDELARAIAQALDRRNN